ncbi:MAG: sulfatase-like hydrolase/transferase [Verrucomicrobiia bacterium]
MHKPHDPFIAPKEYFKRYPFDEIELAKIPEDRTPPLEYSTPGTYNFHTYTDRDRREFKRAYLACTTFVDAQVGKLLDTMDRLDLWDNTIVVLMGDHGYHLGEHSWWNKVTVFDIGDQIGYYNLMDNPEYASIRKELSALLRKGYPVLRD